MSEATTSDLVLDLMIRAATGKTIAGGNVFHPRDWPSKPKTYPILKFTAPDEDKESLGPNAPQYDVIAKITVFGTLSVLPVENDAGAEQVRHALGIFQRQIERAIINDLELYKVISEIPSITVTKMVKNEGEEHLGEVKMDFALKFYQGTWAFAPPDITEVNEIDVFADLINVADPTGTYTPAFPYPVTPSPRVDGPDGRSEAGLVIKIRDESQ